MILTRPVILIIVGISGDLSKRKLLPAIASLAKDEKIGENFRVIGITRRDNVLLEDLLEHVEDQTYLEGHAELFQMDLDNFSEYERLAEYLKEIEKLFGQEAERLIYLSVPPQVSEPIIDLLGTSGLFKVPHTKLLLEKPFGVDLQSAEDLSKHIDEHFDREDVYLIDHYLAKRAVSDLMDPKENNDWDNRSIESIEVTASERLGIEGRARFYEETGALKDFVQSHLLETLVSVLADKSDADSERNISEKRLKALQDLEVSGRSKRGQYKGYREEVGNPESMVETFASISLRSNDPEWQGVSIVLKTGKALDKKFSEIKITFNKDQDDESKYLSIDLDSKEDKGTAYERIILGAIDSDHSLFVSVEEALETWRILEPVLKSWEESSDSLVVYEKGSNIESI